MGAPTQARGILFLAVSQPQLDGHGQDPGGRFLFHGRGGENGKRGMWGMGGMIDYEGVSGECFSPLTYVYLKVL